MLLMHFSELPVGSLMQTAYRLLSHMAYITRCMILLRVLSVYLPISFVGPCTMARSLYDGVIITYSFQVLLQISFQSRPGYM
jgi:hypothetical protein